MKILEGISKEHILKAFTEISRDGIPPGRKSRGVLIEYEGKTCNFDCT